MRKLHNLAIASLLLTASCLDSLPKPKFADVAELLCDGLTAFTYLHDDILSVKLLIERRDYRNALQVAYEVVTSLDEWEDVEGTKELRALIFILEGIIKEEEKKS